MYHFFVQPEQISEDHVIIRGQDVNHIKNVLRMNSGDDILISDGEGSDHHCRISVLKDDEIICDVLGTSESGTELSAKVYLFQGLPKADKFEHIIQKSVELGVYEIVPVATERSIVKYDDKKKKTKTERWNKIAEGAAKQSHRGVIPEVKEVLSFKEALESAKTLMSDGGIVLIPYENYKDIKETKKIIDGLDKEQDIAVFIGPEGGFADSEVEEAMACGAKPISLGNRILRTETAPLMILSVLMFSLET